MLSYCTTFQGAIGAIPNLGIGVASLDDKALDDPVKGLRHTCGRQGVWGAEDRQLLVVPEFRGSRVLFLVDRSRRRVGSAQTCPSKYPDLASFLKFATVLGATCAHVHGDALRTIPHTVPSDLFLPCSRRCSHSAHLGPELEHHLAGSRSHGHYLRVRALSISHRFRRVHACAAGRMSEAGEGGWGRGWRAVLLCHRLRMRQRKERERPAATPKAVAAAVPSTLRR